MSFPDAYDFSAENVGILDLVLLDTAIGPARFILNEDGFFDDTDGHRWMGSKLISVSEIEFSVNGSAPAIEFTFSFIQDPDSADLVQAVKDMGLAAIKGRDATFYIQYMSAIGQFYKPVFPPQKLTSRKMTNLGYSFDGPQIRGLSLTVEGPFNLRSKPSGLRYNTADHSRRVGHDNPSLEYMPTNQFDDEPLFGL